MAKFTVGFKVPTDKYKNASFNPVHMTLCYLGEADQEVIDQVKTELVNLCQHLPLHVKIGSDDLFGLNKNIPVKHILILDDNVKSAFLAFYKRFGKAEPNMPYFEIPDYHLTVKDIADEFPENSNHYWEGKFFIKQLGPHDPIFTIDGKNQ